MFDGGRFGLIAQQRAGAVGVDIVDIGWVDLGVVDCLLHGARCADSFFVRLRDVRGVGAGSVADHLTIDSCSAAAGMFQFFEHEHPAPFGHHEAVAVAIEGPAGLLGLLVALAQSPHIRESADTHGRNRRFASAGDHDVGIVVLDGLEGVAHRVGSTGASRGYGVIGSAQAKLNRKLTTRRVEHQFGNREGRHLVGPLRQQPFHLRFDFVEPADSRSQDHAAAERIGLGKVDPGVAYGVDASDHGELGEAVDPFGFLGRHVIAGGPVVNVAAEVHFVPGGIEYADFVNPAFALEDAFPQILDLATERSNDSQPGYDDASFHVSSLTPGKIRCTGPPVPRFGSFRRRHRGW